jgi:hypothetical protein
MSESTIWDIIDCIQANMLTEEIKDTKLAKFNDKIRSNNDKIKKNIIIIKKLLKRAQNRKDYGDLEGAAAIRIAVAELRQENAILMTENSDLRVFKRDYLESRRPIR